MRCAGVFRTLQPFARANFHQNAVQLQALPFGFLASFRFEPFSSSFHQDMSAATAAAQTFGRKLFTDSAPVLDRKTIPTI